ncbi:MAG: universal stress protein [Ramlibacter sp.]|nr:universal stress protein [Ramlibacter sp.]MBX3657517.1 universal stress protein [Ramlibacter sp.]MCW5649045.1 universal stress protein [Ramlibacter sp.]
MFKHILVPVDGSGTALIAAEKALAMAKAFDSRITLVNVIDYYPFVGVGADYAFGQNEYMAAAKASATKALAMAGNAVKAGGLDCEQKTVEGHVVHEGILEAATSLGADLIIMGSHGRHGIEKLLLGSVTQRVLSHTTLPVLVVRG